MRRRSKISRVSTARVALVTGGTRGIGAAISRRLAKDDFQVFISGRSESSIREAVGRFQKEKLDIRGIPADARREEDQKRLVESVVSAASRLASISCPYRLRRSGSGWA